MERNFYVLAYDIVEDKRRQKIAKLCEAVAERVQDSVFEGYFTPEELQKLDKKVKRIFKKEEDSLRIYRLCSACHDKIQMHGAGKATPPPGVRIV